MATKKIKVSLKLGRRSVTSKIEFARQIVQSMTNNNNFSNPVPALAVVAAAATDLENAFNAAQTGGKQQTAIMYEKELALEALLTQLGHYVEDKDGNVESVIRSAGIDAKKTPSPVGSMPHPSDFSANFGDEDGSILLKCKAIKGSRGYVWQQSGDPLPAATMRIAIPPDTNPVNQWIQAGISTKAKFKITGLESGKRYWFRAAAIGTDGQGPWCDPATKIAP